MARPKKNKTVKENSAVVVGATNEVAKQEEKIGADVVTLRVSLRRGYAIDGVPDGNGSTKTVVLQGLDSALRGKRQGILTPDGNAIFMQLPRADWEYIKKVHGKERMFNSYQGNPACVAEVGSIAEAKTGETREIIESVKTGYAPADPEKMGVTEAKED